MNNRFEVETSKLENKRFQIKSKKVNHIVKPWHSLYPHKPNNIQRNLDSIPESKRRIWPKLFNHITKPNIRTHPEIEAYPEIE